MPVEPETWNNGEKTQSRYSEILLLFESNPDRAYSVGEVTDHLGFTDNSDRTIIVDRLAKIHLSCKLEQLVYDDELDTRWVYGEKHYRLSTN
jgi:hypothetical protein